MQNAARSIMIVSRKICGADTPSGRLAGFPGALPATPLAPLSLRAKPRSSLALGVMVANDMELSFLSMAGAEARSSTYLSGNHFQTVNHKHPISGQSGFCLFPSLFLVQNAADGLD
jgi:hypothetical protein